MTHLKFDGTHLGAYDFHAAISTWWYPCVAETSGKKTTPIFTYLKIAHPDGEDERYPIILKRNTQKRVDQVMIDELKPLFGLVKIGTHQIRLRGVVKKIDDRYPWVFQTENGPFRNAQLDGTWSEYLIFKATCIRHEDVVNFLPLPSLTDVAYYPFYQNNIREGQRNLYRELQKIFVFRDLFRVASSNSGDVLFRFDALASEEYQRRFLASIQQRNYHDPHTDSSKYNLIEIVGQYDPNLPNDRVLPVSIDEVKIKLPSELYKGLSDSIKSYCLQKSDTHAKALIYMLGLTKDNYPDQIEKLRDSISRTIRRFNDDYIWLSDHVSTQIMDKVSVYYNVME